MQNYGASIQLTDRMTPIVTNIMNAVNMTVSSVYQLHSAVSSDFDTSSFDAINESMALAQTQIDDLVNDIDRVGREIDENRNHQVRFNNALNTGNTYASKMNSIFSSIGSILGTYVSLQSAGKLIGLSDDMTGYESRISLLLDDGSVEDVKSKIYSAAQSSRGYYGDMMNSVSRLGMLAGDSFSDAYGNINFDEIIAFQTLMNKNFVVGGASATEQASAMYQLTQAMGSGRLQGDEYRSIIENAPLLAKSIEDYMTNVVGVKGTMKEWAADGLLTADVIKNAVFSSADEVESRFESMPMTWGQVWNECKNTFVGFFDPVLNQINDLANNQEFMTVFGNVTNSLSYVSGIVSELINMFANGAVWISNNWSIISPILGGVATAIGIVALAYGVYNAVQMIHNIQTQIEAVQKYKAAQAALTHSAGLTAEEIAMHKATIAQSGFNTAMLASPVTWIILALIALVAVIFVVINAVNKATGSTTSAIGVIFGAICAVGAAIVNIVIGLINSILQYVWTYFVEPFIGIIEWILNVCNGGFDSFGGAVANLVGNIISWFLSLGKVVTTIIDAIFGTDWTSGLNSLQNDVLSWGKTENSITISRDAPKINRLDLTDAYDWGYTKGDSLSDKVSNMFSFENELENSALTETADYTASIADTTSDIADTVSASSDDELEWLRKIAERETVNRFTTAEIKLDFQSNATINSDIDIDGFINTLTDEVKEAVITSAESVSY